VHILLTDILTCPRCGPRAGLILLSDRIEDRRIASGRLGCANCREVYPIEDGFADLRHPSVPGLETCPPGGEPREDRAVRIAALLGAQPPNATLLLVGGDAALATRVAEIFPEVHLVVSAPEPAGEVGAHVAFSSVAHGVRLPFRDASFRGVAVVDVAVEPIALELARVLVPGARVVADGAPTDAEERLRDSGLHILLAQGTTVVAATPGHR
jgi:uncharacterized protein YbaR (Trm112 family)